MPLSTRSARSSTPLLADAADARLPVFYYAPSACLLRSARDCDSTACLHAFPPPQSPHITRHFPAKPSFPSAEFANLTNAVSERITLADGSVLSRNASTYTAALLRGGCSSAASREPRWCTKCVHAAGSRARRDTAIAGRDLCVPCCDCTFSCAGVRKNLLVLRCPSSAGVALIARDAPPSCYRLTFRRVCPPPSAATAYWSCQVARSGRRCGTGLVEFRSVRRAVIRGAAAAS